MKIHILTLSLLLATKFASATITDVSQPLAPAIDGFKLLGTGQSFTAVQDGYIDSLRLFIGGTGNAADVNISLYLADSSGVPTGSPLATGFISKVTIPIGSKDWISISLSNSYLQSSQTHYAFVLDQPSGSATDYTSYGFSNTNPYNGGTLIYASTITTTDPTIDLAFETIITPVPEPTIPFLMCVAFAVFTFLRSPKGRTRRCS
jgi:hypothetical protein